MPFRIGRAWPFAVLALIVAVLNLSGATLRALAQAGPEAVVPGLAGLARVVANGAHRDLAPLPDALAGAERVTEGLAALGYEGVQVVNAEAGAFRAVIEAFAPRAGSAPALVVYLAGHGFDRNRTTLLAFVDARFDPGDGMPAGTVPRATVLDQLSRPGRLTVVVLDAARAVASPGVVRPDGLLPGIEPVPGTVTDRPLFTPAPGVIPETVEVIVTDPPPADLARAVQQELARVGCYRLTVDGAWGRGSRAALAGFARRSGQQLGDEPTVEVRTALRAARGAVCTAPPPEPAGRVFGAIAFARNSFDSPEGASVGWGTSAGRPSARLAAGAAMAACTNNDPVVTDRGVVLTIARGCGALAVGAQVIGTGTGATRPAAQAAAMAGCGRRGSGCRPVAATCTEP
jgi:hypothetical protein